MRPTRVAEILVFITGFRLPVCAFDVGMLVAPTAITAAVKTDHLLVFIAGVRVGLSPGSFAAQGVLGFEGASLFGLERWRMISRR